MWCHHWHAALEKFGLARDGRPLATAEERASVVMGESGKIVRGRHDSRGGKVDISGAMQRVRRGGIQENDDDALCRIIRVAGHGPSDLQCAPVLFLPVSCVPPSLRRALAKGDETVCFFMSWSASLSDRWHDEVTCDV